MNLMGMIKTNKSEFLIRSIPDTISVSKNEILYEVLMNGKPVMVTEDYEIARELVLNYEFGSLQ